MRFRALIASAAAALAAACTPLAPPGPQLPPVPPDRTTPYPNAPTLTPDKSFVTQTLTDAGLSAVDHPWDIAFVPGSTVGFFTERGHTINTTTPATPRISSFDTALPTGSPAKLLGNVDDVRADGEAGLMGIAVDPDFATNHYIYICVSDHSSGFNEIRRYTVSLDTLTLPGAGLTGETVMRQLGPISVFFLHNGCRIRFQPGTTPPALWIAVGDGAQPTAPQSLTSPSGKVLRVQVDNVNNALLPYPGNPYESVANPTQKLVFTNGHRNPQGLAFQPGTNVTYSSEHGESTNDEVNRLVPGGNGGWDPNDGSGKYYQGGPMTDLQKFPNAMRPSWRSGDVQSPLCPGKPACTKAPSGMTFLSGAQWEGWDGALVVAFLKDRRVRVMFPDGNGFVADAWPDLVSTTRLRSVVQGPDGYLYVSTDAGAPNDGIWKVVPS